MGNKKNTLNEDGGIDESGDKGAFPTAAEELAAAGGIDNGEDAERDAFGVEVMSEDDSEDLEELNNGFIDDGPEDQAKSYEVGDEDDYVPSEDDDDEYDDDEDDDEDEDDASKVARELAEEFGDGTAAVPKDAAQDAAASKKKKRKRLDDSDSDGDEDGAKSKKKKKTLASDDDDDNQDTHTEGEESVIVLGDGLRVSKEDIVREKTPENDSRRVALVASNIVADTYRIVQDGDQQVRRSGRARKEVQRFDAEHQVREEELEMIIARDDFENLIWEHLSKLKELGLALENCTKAKVLKTLSVQSTVTDRTYLEVIRQAAAQYGIPTESCPVCAHWAPDAPVCELAQYMQNDGTVNWPIVMSRQKRAVGAAEDPATTFDAHAAGLRRAARSQENTQEGDDDDDGSQDDMSEDDTHNGGEDDDEDHDD